MTHPSEPAPERGEVEALIRACEERAAGYGAFRKSSVTAIVLDRSAAALASLSAELERLRTAAAPPADAMIVHRATACLHRHVGKSATIVCVADGDHDGWHVFHRIENVSVIEPGTE